MADQSHDGPKSLTAAQLIAVVSDAATASTLDAWAKSRGVVAPQIRIAQADTDFLFALPQRRPLILVLELGDVSPERVAMVERMARGADDGCAVIALFGKINNDDMRRLFRAGVGDVLNTASDGNELRGALDNTLSQFPDAQEGTADRLGKLYTVFKTGGGTGATLLSINLARELAHRRAGRIALVDLDVQFGTLETALDMPSRLNLTDAIRASERLDHTMLGSMMVSHKSGFDVLMNGKSIAPVDVITENFIERFIATLKPTYDHIIFDMPTSWGRWFYNAARASTQIMPVVEPTVRCADGARRLAQGFEDLGLAGLSMMPIANRADRTPEVRRRLKEIADILGAPVECIVREDTKTASLCADTGACARDISATAPLTQDIEAIAARLCAEVTPPTDAKPAREGASRFKLFGSRS